MKRAGRLGNGCVDVRRRYRPSRGLVLSRRDGQRCLLRPESLVPGDSLFHLTQNHVVSPINWDMGVCHTYFYVPWGQGNVGANIWEGANPPPPDQLPAPLPVQRPPAGMCWAMWIPAPCPNG
jgi:hypothetical protein